jgi:hypothetical protein
MQPARGKNAELGHLVRTWCRSVFCIKNKIEEVDVRPGKACQLGV